jgi:hypothetical protein
MGILALGYPGLGSARPDDRSAFATCWTGMHTGERRLLLSGRHAQAKLDTMPLRAAFAT